VANNTSNVLGFFALSVILVLLSRLLPVAGKVLNNNILGFLVTKISNELGINGVSRDVSIEQTAIIRFKESCLESETDHLLASRILESTFRAIEGSGFFNEVKVSFFFLAFDNLVVNNLVHALDGLLHIPVTSTVGSTEFVADFVVSENIEHVVTVKSFTWTLVESLELTGLLLEISFPRFLGKEISRFFIKLGGSFFEEALLFLAPFSYELVDFDHPFTSYLSWRNRKPELLKRTVTDDTDLVVFAVTNHTVVHCSGFVEVLSQVDSLDDFLLNISDISDVLVVKRKWVHESFDSRGIILVMLDIVELELTVIECFTDELSAAWLVELAL
jgi:hypothetical protein